VHWDERRPGVKAGWFRPDSSSTAKRAQLEFDQPGNCIPAETGYSAMVDRLPCQQALAIQRRVVQAEWHDREKTPG
jgi:hypothetical protein